MKNFTLLDQEEYESVWNNFDNLYNFKPSVKHFPAVDTHQPQLKFNITSCFSEDFPMEKLEDYALKLFQSISKPGDRLYALDWQHDSFHFDPRKKMDRNEFEEWIVPVLPNGDYSIFLTKDLKNVWFGHPWEQAITLIGLEIVTQSREFDRSFIK